MTTSEPRAPEGATTIEGARLLTADGLEEAPLTFAGGVIVDRGGGRRVDARGLILAPALIDLHGDAFERQVSPRPGVFAPLDVALLDTDRQLAANGIATAYHALTLGWEPGLRSVGRGRDFVAALDRLTPRLTVENRVQLRWETFAFEAEPLVREALAGRLTPSLAFNDHTSMAMRAFGTSVQDRGFELSPDFHAASLGDARLRQRTAKNAKRAGLDEDAYVALLAQVWERRADVPAMIATLAQAAREAGAPMLSHDDTRAETRDWFRGHGVTVAEFPMVAEAAQRARDGGDTIVMGAPNVMRGGSHIGSLGAADMVEAGMCDALASDYFYPALLAAVARLHAERRAPLPDLWALVSSGPARAMGLHDRGTLDVGQRADLVLLDWPEGQAPTVRALWVAGRPALALTPALAGEAA
jgi:alpha-D-ribose 1-methylphosphonate 5-triphosphate diphosphatase